MTAEPARWATRGWWMAASLALAAGLLFTIFLGLTSRPVYTASTMSFVSMGTESAAESDPFAGSPFVLQRMGTYADLATSPQVLQPVIDELRLPFTWDALAARVTATNPPATVLLTVQVRDDDATRADKIADAVAAQQARAVERLEAAGGSPEQGPVRVTVVDRATSRAASSLLWYLAIAVEVALAAVLVVAAFVARQRLRRVPEADRRAFGGTPRRARRGRPAPVADTPVSAPAQVREREVEATRAP